jgi:hypothetical protein
MESFSVIRASSFRALRPWLFDKIIPLELINAVKQRYQFVNPDTSSFSSNAPIDFQAGKFQYDGKTISVEQFVVTHIGNRATSLGVSTRMSSDASDAFLDNVIEWAATEYGLDANEVLPRSYFSQVEFVLSKPVSSYFTELNEVGKAITDYVQGYGLENCPPYEFGGFSMHFDLVKYDNLTPRPQPFAIERRVGSSYEERKYFSQAPLRTKDHKTIVERLEGILKL